MYNLNQIFEEKMLNLYFSTKMHTKNKMHSEHRSGGCPVIWFQQQKPDHKKNIDLQQNLLAVSGNFSYGIWI